jgi:hypothetical protein
MTARRSPVNPRIRTLLNVLAAVALVAGLLNFCAFFLQSSRIGGSVTNGVFHPNHGIMPERPPSAEELAQNARLTNLLCLTVPLVVAALFYIFKTELYPLFYSRGSYDQAVAAVKQIQGSGAPVCRAAANCIIGGTPVGGYRRIAITVYSGGIVLSGVSGMMFGPFGVGTEEIRSASIARRYNQTGLLICHIGPLGNPLFIHHAPQELVDAVLSIAQERESLPDRR